MELNKIVDEIKDMLQDSLSKSIDPKPEDEVEKKYEDCGCETCKKLDVSCDKCPDCSKGEMDKAEMTDTKDCKCNGCMECKAAGGCDMEMCKGHDNMYKAEELSDEDISKSYESDNEEEDNWDNMEKACWSGYKQVGMKDKNGKKVPNCVPIKKSIFGSEGPQDLIPKNK